MGKTMSQSTGQEMNALTKECIFTALMLLMKEKDYSAITITDLTKKAGVSRMAYYRNYNSKEDIIIQYMDEVFNDYFKEVIGNYHEDFSSIYTAFFSHFRKNRELVEVLIQANLTDLLLKQFDGYIRYVEKGIFAKLLPNNIDKYELYYAAGGLYKILLEWAKGGMKESDEEMAATVMKLSQYLDLNIDLSKLHRSMFLHILR